MVIYHFEIKSILSQEFAGDGTVGNVTNVEMLVTLVVEIMSNAAMQLCQGKHIIARLMLPTKYSCCYNSLIILSSHS